MPPDLGFLQATAIGREIFARDWGCTSLGPITSWPVSLRTTLSVMLACPMPMYLAWGPELLSFYNEAYRPILGYREPKALGTPFRALWASLWDDIAPLVDAALLGNSQEVKDMRLDVSRQGVPEESYWTFSYSPAFDDEGRIAGLFCVTGETTDRVLAERERDASDERLQLALSAGNSIGIWDWDVVNDRVTSDSRFAQLYGVDLERAERGAPIAEFFAGIHPDDLPRVQAEIGRAMQETGAFVSEYRLLREDAEVRWVTAQGRVIRDEAGKRVRFPGVSYEITDRKMAELALRAAKEEREFVLELAIRHRLLTDPDAILRLSADLIGRRLGVSRVGYYRVLGGNRLQHSGAWSDGTLPRLMGEQAASMFGAYSEIERRGGRTLVFGDSRTDQNGQLELYAANDVLAGICVPLFTDGQWAAGIYLHQRSARQWTDQEIALVQEVTNLTWISVERADAVRRLGQRLDLQSSALAKSEAELQEQAERREVAEHQLHQLQKMEAVGQLAGGIAHDFNNMLAIVISGLNLSQRRLARGDADIGQFLDGAMDGATRASALTQRLLAFSRQQALAPVAIDGNRLISDLTDLLTRSLGELVELETVLNAGLWKAKADPSQLENAIINLAVNARDAMPGGGKLTIETANAYIDEDYAREAAIASGQYVLISVTDSGSGMTGEVLSRAFDPFYTTKEIGKGTGLGLSQVFGFLRQSNGHVRIYSELGHGTTVKLYLPRFWGNGEPANPRRVAQPLRGGNLSEVVLVVEDEERVRALTVETLRELGYTVLEAGNGPEALAVLTHRSDVVLLITDVVMPGMTGRALADLALSRLPKLRVIYMTGYTRNAVVHNGILDPGTNFLMKPFGIDQLAAKVREVLEAG